MDDLLSKLGASPHPILDMGLKNLVRHDLRHHGDRYNLFCDAFSQFGVAFPGLAPLGLGAACPKATLSTYHITNPTLQLSFREKDTLISIQRQDLECLPWLTTEKSHLPTANNMVHIEARHVFKDERALVSSFRLINRSNERLKVEPCWQGRITGEHELYMLPYFGGKAQTSRTPFLKTIPAGITGGLQISRPQDDLPQVAIRIRDCNNVLTATVGEDMTYIFSPVDLIDLDPGASIDFQFLIEISFIAPNQAAFEWPSETLTALPFDELVDDVRRRFAAAIALDKKPAVASNALELMAWRARYALLRNGMRGRDGEFGDEVACLCTSDNTDFSCVFFWDTLFSSVAISDFHSHYARGAIRTAFVRQDERDGSTPERKFNYTPRGRMAQQSPQSPVASWAVRAYLEKNDDPAFLREMYPALKRNHEFWEIYSDTDRDGLAEFRWSGQICDNSPLWDDYAVLDATSGCGWLPPVASVALNSFLYWDANHLKVLADVQGLTEDGDKFQQRANQIERDLFTVCYLPEEKRFWDYNHHTRRHTRIKTFYMFWPLFAGMNVPPEATKDLIEEVLLDPNQFFGSTPFPSVAYDEPTYNPKGYWRGRSWPHITYWLLQTLVRHGYVNEAKEAAGRTLEAYSRSSGYPENIPSRLKDLDAAGFADYNWGSATVYLIATEEYLKV